MSNETVNPKCKYCGLHLEILDKSKRASHVRWCTSNPDINQLKLNLHKARESITVEIRDKISKSIKDLHMSGHYDATYDKLNKINKNRNYHHNEESRRKISEAARKSNHQRVCKKSHVFIDKRMRTFTFDSSWEDALAVRLDELNILWDRPQPIIYQLPSETKYRKYYPDFYLPEYNLYLDPKNDYCVKVQAQKLDVVSKQINLIIIQSLDECKQFKI